MIYKSSAEYYLFVLNIPCQIIVACYIVGNIVIITKFGGINYKTETDAIEIKRKRKYYFNPHFFLLTNSLLYFQKVNKNLLVYSFIIHSSFPIFQIQ